MAGLNNYESRVNATESLVLNGKQISRIVVIMAFNVPANM